MTKVETVTIIVAFAVLAAVALYLFLNSGMIIAERGTATVYVGAKQVKSDVEVAGQIMRNLLMR